MKYNMDGNVEEAKLEGKKRRERTARRRLCAERTRLYGCVKGKERKGGIKNGVYS